MIICGYAGTGKSTAAKKIAGVVDLESTPFQKDWETYARVAKHMSDQGYIVLLSCHKELREELHRIGADYIVVYPEKNQKEIYRQRYIERGNTEEFIEAQMKHWNEWVGATLHWTDEDGWVVEEKAIFLTTRSSGRIETMTDFLDDFFEYGEELFKIMKPTKYL